ncbi:nucleoporin-like protein 2 [Phthorimaea operculella]|nr:nucleoporin-like protein 2 [Phthorimaea operculella]
MIIAYCVCALAALSLTSARSFVFPDEVQRREKKLEPIITPPVLPRIEHLERDPSTLLPSERNNQRGQVKPRFDFGGGFNVAPSNGGLTASISSSANGGGASHSASQSFSFGFNEGFSASHSASQASSFNGFGSSFGGSQASSQAASFGGGGNSVSGAASSAAAFGGHGGSGSQSASQAFGFNSLNGFQSEPSFGDGLLDVRHRGVPDFPVPRFPGFPGRSKGITADFPIPSFTQGRSKGVAAGAFRSGKTGFGSDIDDFIGVLVSD